MLLSRFSCPECSATLKPAKPQPEGVRVKCPRCSTVFSVAANDRDEAEDVAEPAPVRRTSLTQKPSSPRRRPTDDFEDDEEDRPRRTSRGSRDNEDDEDDRPTRPRRASREDDDREEDRPPRRGKRRAKQKSAGLRGLWIGLGVTGGLAAVAVVGVVVYFAVRPLVESKQHRQVRALDEATSLLSQVNDQASAERVRDPLVKIGERLHAWELEDREKLEAALKDLDSKKVNEAIDKAMANPQAAEEESRRIMALKKPAEEAMQRLIKEGRRVWNVPGGKELLTAFCTAWDKPPLFGLPDLGGFPNLPNPGGGLTPPAGNPFPGASPSKVNKDSWARVQVGMPESQAIEILGQPLVTHPFPSGDKALHFHGGGFAGILTIKEGKVVSKNPG